jgi:hypothetical protein
MADQWPLWRRARDQWSQSFERLSLYLTMGLSHFNGTHVRATTLGCTTSRADISALNLSYALNLSSRRRGRTDVVGTSNPERLSG